ncbi:MAG: hypothetical protein WC867_00305 [Candidatus Pacearchaeota archaeon]|jgi:20S proteasome alpha/beta subunit
MTYILGARCSDGVVLVADTKITIEDGADYAYSKKITNPLTTVVMGAAGIGGLYKDFQNRIVSAVVQAERSAHEEARQLIITEEQFGVLVNQIIRNMHSDYDEDRHLIINNLMILCATRMNRDVATLTTFNPYGFPEPVNTYRAIGHGEPYGSLFLKKMWNKNMTMEETAKLGIFIIKFIQSMKLDSSVGFNEEFLPQVCYIPDVIVPENFNHQDQKAIEKLLEKYKIKELDNEEVDHLLNQVSSKISDFESLFKSGQFKI